MTGQEKKINMSDFNTQIGNWKVYLYDNGGAGTLSPIRGQLSVDNIKYIIKDSQTGEPVFVAPSGNVAFVINIDKASV